jgi:hypothetical protein
MNMDNRVFNVNGQGDEMLLVTLRLAFQQESPKCTAKAYIIDPVKGMILLWHTDGGIAFPSQLSPEAVLPIVSSWLASKPEIECKSWDGDHDHDGHNSLGWRVYVEDWGHVKDIFHAICAIKPAYLWHGK